MAKVTYEMEQPQQDAPQLSWVDTRRKLAEADASSNDPTERGSLARVDVMVRSDVTCEAVIVVHLPPDDNFSLANDRDRRPCAVLPPRIPEFILLLTPKGCTGQAKETVIRAARGLSERAVAMVPAAHRAAVANCLGSLLIKLPRHHT